MARYALVIGIAEYESKHLANLSKPVQDADEIATLLHKYGQCDKEPMVLKGKVTTQQLVEALQTFLTKQAVNSEAIIYFTGHGISVKEPLGPSQGYLTTSDCEVSLGSDLKPIGQQNAISFASLNSLIQGANLSNLIMLIDVCHSGDFIEQAVVEQSFSAFSARQDHLLITACRDFEAAFARKSDDHSLFTGAVLDALVPEKADADGIITGDSLFASLSRTLKGSRQEPVRFGKGRSLRIVQFPAELLPESTLSGTNGAARQLRVPRMPLQMPPLPDHFVERPKYQQAVKGQLLCEEFKVGTLVVSAIYGLGGIGKSVLASKLAHDDEIQAHFCDGILWATLGQNPDILPLLSDWIQALGDYDYKPTSIEGASNQLRTLLYNKRVLLVVDDVWNPEHLEPFRIGGEGCCVLVTTREAKIQSSHRYDLDVMNVDQALELMTQKLSGTLSEINQKCAIAFAKRVGYLPLALELAASQIEEGVTWSELLEDLQDEVVRLETLDIYGQEEMPDDAKRRKYSLLACFNLSLKQLSADQLQQFAWLGILPEDVSLTQEMAETLWQVTSRQARAILRTFKTKALVLQGVQQANNQPSYRMHDLMHDFAGRLLISPSEPLREGELPGLGLTKAEAHSELINHYRAKTQNGHWHTLEDDGYIYAHLTWHMEQARQFQYIHQLLRVANEQGHNGWYEACDAIGKTAGFVNDLGRAWKLTTNQYEEDASASVTLLFHYAAIRSSLNSLASNVPAKLVKVLIEKEIWQVAQGLAYAQQVQNPWQRAECIAAIVSYIPMSLLPEVLKTIGHISDAAYRSYVLGELVDHFPEVWPDLLATIQQIQDRFGDHRQQTQGFSHRALAICKLAQKLPLKHLSPAIEITYQIQDTFDQVNALIALAQIRSELWSEVLKVTYKIQSEYSRSRALITLAEHLPESLWPEVFEIIRQIQAESYRSTTLSSIVKYLPETLWPEVLKITYNIQDESYRSSTICALIEHLPKKLLPEVLQDTCRNQDESYRASTLNTLIEYLPEALLSEVLDIAYCIQDKYSQSVVLCALAQHLPDLRAEALEITRQIQSGYSRLTVLCTLAQHSSELWYEVLEITRQFQDDSYRSIAFSALVTYLPEELWPEALEIIRQFQDESYRFIALRTLAAHLPEKLWPEALEITCKFQNESSWSFTLRVMAEYLPETLLSRALEITCQLQDESSRAVALRALADYLPETLLSEALAITHQIQSESSRSSILAAFAEHLSETLFPKALEITSEIQDQDARSSVLSALAEHLPEMILPKALEVTRQIQDQDAQSRTLRTLAEHLPELWPEALEITCQIQDRYLRALALSALAEHLPELWLEVLEVTCQIKNEEKRSYALNRFVEHLPNTLLFETLEATRQIQDLESRSYALSALAKHIPELWPETLEIIRQIQSEYVRSRALIACAKELPELWPEALEITRQIQDEEYQARALRALAEYLPETLWHEVLEITRQIQDKYSQVRVLVELAQHLPELWSEAIENTRQLKNEEAQAQALCNFTEYLPEALWPEVLEITHQIQDEQSRAWAMNKLSEHLPKMLWLKALDIIWGIKDKYYCAIALQGFLPKLDQLSISFLDWVKVLDILAYQNRDRWLKSLPESRPMILKFGSEKAVSDTLKAVQEVCRQWP